MLEILDLLKASTIPKIGIGLDGDIKIILSQFFNIPKPQNDLVKQF